MVNKDFHCFACMTTTLPKSETFHFKNVDTRFIPFSYSLNNFHTHTWINELIIIEYY